MLAILCVGAANPIRQTIEVMDLAGSGIALVVDGDSLLFGTVIDGDLRRALLDNIDISLLLVSKKGTPFECPVVARVGQPNDIYIKVLHAHRIGTLPLLDAEGRVAGLVTLGD